MQDEAAQYSSKLKEKNKLLGESLFYISILEVDGRLDEASDLAERLRLTQRESGEYQLKIKNLMQELNDVRYERC
jgi:hypothetical protein